MTAVIVLDFDGTMTDAEAEGTPFRVGYIADLKVLVGAETAEEQAKVDAIARRVETELTSYPERHPFRWAGREVAPASVDPYLRMVPIADAVFNEYGVFASLPERGRLTGGVLYRYNYERTLGRPVFRDGAGATLQALAGSETYVVTNSHTTAVQDKVRRLDADVGGVAWLAARIHGDARKFDIDDSWAGAPSELRVPGLRRPVLLRRRRYYERLCSILRPLNASFADLTVIGDIFELDLALPLALGARVGLVASPYTPPYEQAFVAEHPRGRVFSDLTEVAPWARGEA